MRILKIDTGVICGLIGWLYKLIYTVVVAGTDNSRY